MDEEVFKNCTSLLTQRKLLWREWHERLGHMEPQTMENLSRKGKIPRILENVHPTVCAACQYGKATRRRLIQKAMGNLRNHLNKPGACVSVYKMITTTPGRKITLNGKPTHKCYYVVTIFVELDAYDFGEALIR